MVASFETVQKAWVKNQCSATYTFTVSASSRNCRKKKFSPLGMKAHRCLIIRTPILNPILQWGEEIEERCTLHRNYRVFYPKCVFFQQFSFRNSAPDSKLMAQEKK